MLFEVCLGFWFPEDSILKLLLQCCLVVGEVCVPATPIVAIYCSAVTFTSQEMFRTSGPVVVSVTSRVARIVATWSLRTSMAGSGQPHARRWPLPTRFPTVLVSIPGVRLDTKRFANLTMQSLKSMEQMSLVLQYLTTCTMMASPGTMWRATMRNRSSARTAMSCLTMWPLPTRESVSNFSILMCYIYYLCKLHSATQFTCLSNMTELSWLRLNHINW